MRTSLTDILSLVGPLDDNQGSNTARDRFRTFLKKNVREVGELRDHIEECLRNSGDQFNRALQDLVNFLGEFLGFEVAYGRYRGVTNDIGFDGHWKSRTGFHIVVEVKTTNTYAIKTSTLLSYVDDLISAKSIPDRESTLGLYVLGRPDNDLRQLENAIVAERRAHQLRTVTIESLLTLAELMSDYDVSHEDVLAILRPSEPTADGIIDLLSRLTAERDTPAIEEAPVEQLSAPSAGPRLVPAADGETVYCLTPVKDHETETACQCVEKLVGKLSMYAIGPRTPGRKHIKPGDWIAFYANTVGVVAHARVATAPENKPSPHVLEPERYSYSFKVENAVTYCDRPVVLDPTVRRQLSAFSNRDPDKPWAWFVQATRRISKADFELLTRKDPRARTASA